MFVASENFKRCQFFFLEKKMLSFWGAFIDILQQIFAVLIGSTSVYLVNHFFATQCQSVFVTFTFPLPHTHPQKKGAESYKAQSLLSNSGL